jgi:DNA-binding transcriptional MerR regulator
VSLLSLAFAAARAASSPPEPDMAFAPFEPDSATVSAVPPTGSDSGETPPRRYTIDELVTATGVPSRTIRFYQASGALPAPKREGRMAYYDDQHVERLKLVAELQDRGLSLKAIRDLVERIDTGDVTVSEWLGVGDQLRAPWSEDRPRMVSESELTELLGGSARPGLVSELVRAGLLRREGAGNYVLESPALLRLGLKVDAAGVDLGDAVYAVEILNKRLRKAADEIVEHFAKRAQEPDQGAQEISRRLEALRAVAGEAVRVLFAREIERALGEMIERGKVLPPRRRR